jgi:hypothetical protein
MKYYFYVAFIGTLGQEMTLGMFNNSLLMTIGLFKKKAVKVYNELLHDSSSSQNKFLTLCDP